MEEKFEAVFTTADGIQETLRTNTLAEAIEWISSGRGQGCQPKDRGYIRDLQPATEAVSDEAGVDGEEDEEGYQVGVGYDAQIYVGGRVPRSLLDKITGGKLEFPHNSGRGGCALETVDGRLALVCCGKPYGGEFEFEDELEEAGVPFDRLSQFWEVDCQDDSRASFRPGAAKVEAGCDMDATPLLMASTVKAILDDPEMDPASQVQRLRGTEGVGILYLREAHPLPALELVDDLDLVPVP